MYLIQLLADGHPLTQIKAAFAQENRSLSVLRALATAAAATLRLRPGRCVFARIRLEGALALRAAEIERLALKLRVRGRA